MRHKGVSSLVLIVIAIVVGTVVVSQTPQFKQYLELPTPPKVSQFPDPSKFPSFGNQSYPKIPGFPDPSQFPDTSKYPDTSQFPSFDPSQFPNPSQLPSSGSVSIFPSRTPACADANKDYYGQLVYARPSDGKDRYDIKVPILRKWIAYANGIVNTEAKQFGVTADLKIACKDGEISVLNIILPISSTSTVTSGTIYAALKDRGLTNTRIKYIVWYDGEAVGCGGGDQKCTAQFSNNHGPDDRLSEDNLYNTGGDFAVVFGVEDELTGPIRMLHEYAHNMGAVQFNAPHSTGEGHCNDEPPIDKGGTDVMCKSDNPSTTFENSCSGYQFRFDCNNDDYFNPKPKAGSYLATHWNLGSTLNRFIAFGK